MLNEQQNESSFNVQSVDRIERSEENLPTPIVINEGNKSSFEFILPWRLDKRLR